MTVVDLSDRKRVSWRWLFFLGWTAVVLIQTMILYVHIKVPFWYALLNQGFEFYTLAVLSLVVWRVNLRLHAMRLSSWEWVAAQIALGVSVLVVWQGLNALLLRSWLGPDFWDQVFAQNWMFQLASVVMTYLTILGMTLAAQSARRERERERQQALLEITARESELAALKAQLQPHFLFNALNSVLDLIDTDPVGAREMVVRLADLLQAALRRIDLEQVSLDREIDLIRAYLDIEKIRFASRLSVDIDVGENAGAAQVPPFLLQPIVENAVKHGIGNDPAGGQVRVGATVTDGRLRVEVRDSGRGFDPDVPVSGRGLEMTRRRLESVYGSDFRLSFGGAPGRFAVTLELPLLYA